MSAGKIKKPSPLSPESLRVAEVIRTARDMARIIHAVDGNAPDEMERPIALTGPEWMALLSLANVITLPEEE